MASKETGECVVCDDPDVRDPTQFKKYEAFMWILIQYYKAYQKYGLKEVVKQTNEYKKEMDMFPEWIERS